MSFSDHKITAFTHKIVDLPDQPNLPADELKARFDSSPEELRQAVNGICDEGEALSARIDSYRAQTFTGEIERDMLAPEVQEELSAKADETSVASRLASESLARSDGDANLSARITAAEGALPDKVGIYYGSYTGDGSSSRSIYLGFRPKAVLVICTQTFSFNSRYAAGSWIATTTLSSSAVSVTDSGFTINNSNSSEINEQAAPYMYLAFR